MFTEIADAMALLRSQVAIINDPAISAADIPRAERVRSLRDGDDRGTRYIAVGRLVAQKNFALLIGAFAAMAGPQDCLTILGDGPERTSLTRLIAEVGMTGQVYMPGHIGPVIERLKASDVFVLSSDYEGVPAVIIEALAAGLVIVATDCSVSMASLLEHGALGELVPRRSLWCLEQAMRAAAVRTPDPGRARRQASRFTVECAADAYAALFARQITKARNVPNPEKNSHGADAML